MRIRLYGKVLNTWKSEDDHRRVRLTQKEVAYTEYETETGEVVGVGSEDFSPSRYNREVDERWVWTWDGTRRNKGGHRWFECCGLVKFRKSERKEVKRFLSDRYHAVDIQLRD